MLRLDNVGSEWLEGVVEGMVDRIARMGPVEFNETYRYLTDSVTPLPGKMDFRVNPYMIEILECVNPDSPIREVNLKKGVKVTYTTVLESIIYYEAAHIKTTPGMYMTADKELAIDRIDGNIIPMFNDAGFQFQSLDIGNKRKTGKTAQHLQWPGGGSLRPLGANNPKKMRQYAVLWFLKDEIDGWPDTVGKDGCPDALSDARCDGYWMQRKIFRGSTPLVKGTSKIQKAFLRGDQRQYLVCCLECGYPQALKWSGTNSKTKKKFGLAWDMDGGQLVESSVRYQCQNCAADHFDYDKRKLFALDRGAHWSPTATPVDPFIRSYHLPGYYSPAGMKPWSQNVQLYLEAYDTEAKRVRDIGKFQVFYNNVLGEPFEVRGAKITFAAVSAHRRAIYRLGEVPNEYARQYSGSDIQFLTCQVDVHKKFLAVAVMGWTKGARCYLIDYLTFEDDSEIGCADVQSPVWGQVREVVEERKWTADNGKIYGVAMTLIDASWETDTVDTFCSAYDGGVYPIMGREKTAKVQKIQEFAEFKTQAGQVGFRILIDHYKDRLAPVLRREWIEESGTQGVYHFNAAVDTKDKHLKELTAETRKEKFDERGNVSYVWHRSGNARNELWDLLVYGHAAVEILAWQLCIKYFETEKVDWEMFWDYVEEQKLFFT